VAFASSRACVEARTGYVCKELAGTGVIPLEKKATIDAAAIFVRERLEGKGLNGEDLAAAPAAQAPRVGVTSEPASGTCTGSSGVDRRPRFTRPWPSSLGRLAQEGARHPFYASSLPSSPVALAGIFFLLPESFPRQEPPSGPADRNSGRRARTSAAARTPRWRLLPRVRHENSWHLVLRGWRGRCLWQSHA